MFKKLILITFFLFLTINGYAFAHTGLESSSPQNGETTTEEIQQITLTFETKIEQGSTLQIKNSAGSEISVSNISINENQLIGVLGSPLDNGDYQAHWQIIGADGHQIEGDFSFTVKREITENPVVDETETPSQTDKDSNETEQESNAIDQNTNDPETNVETTEQTEQENEQNQLPSYLVPAIIVTLLLIIIGSFIFMRRKK